MKKEKGITLIGVLIGITILSIALAAQIKLLGNTIRREGDLRNLIIATNLAREGIEIGFTWRNSFGWAYLKKNMFNQDLCSDIRLKPETGDCKTKELNPVGFVDYDNKAYSEFKSYLYRAPEGVLNTPPFWRTIRIEACEDQPDTSICMVLKSRVGWENNKSVEITKKIYNWYVP